MRLLREICGCAVLLLLAGCSSLPAFHPETRTEAIPLNRATELGLLAASAQPDADLSGFRLLPSGEFALHARLELAGRAQSTLDIQYYQIHNDRVGRTVLRAARDAALRGVRVRLIVDDLYTSGEDELFLAFAATPNVEMRLFNPFPAGRSSFVRRFAASLTDFRRVNHRMHNKLFIADGAIAVAGGRNLGDEYFAQSTTENFVDIDTVVAGALIPRLAHLFDAYWNSPYVRPVKQIAFSALTPEKLRDRFEEMTGPSTTAVPKSPPPNDLLGHSPIAEDFAQSKLDLTWAVAEAYADDPARVIEKRTEYGGAALLDVDSVSYNVIENIRRAREDVTVISPYLIPGNTGLDEIGSLRNRGVKLTLITNSLASTDEPLVYTAYRRYRPALLHLGVDIWELSSSRSSRSLRLGIFGSHVGRLHSKSAVIDGKTLFIGSMNFDPRSANDNTELGLIIHSDELARQQLKLLGSLKDQGAYRLRVSADGGGVEWVSNDGTKEHVLNVDPDTTYWQRTIPSLLAPLVPENML